MLVLSGMLLWASLGGFTGPAPGGEGELDRAPGSAARAGERSPPPVAETLVGDSDDSSDSGAGEGSRGWIQLAPAGVSVPGPRITPDLRVFDEAVRIGYRWGLAAGMVFEPIEGLLVGATASLDHHIWLFETNAGSYELCFDDGCYGWRERGVGSLLRFGGDLRVGWTRRWFMVWGLMSLQINTAHMRLDCDNSVEDHCDRGETDVGPGLGGGMGAAVRVTRSLAIGVEGSIDHAWLDTRDDPFRAARTWDLALVGVVRF